MPIIFISILMLIFWIQYHVKKSRNTRYHASAAFWMKEEEANHTRNKDIESLPYLQVPLESLPLESTTDSYLIHLHNTLTKIASEKIIDLSNYTNTELKLTYGTVNFTYLSEYDANFTTLLQTVEAIAAYHMSKDHVESAIAYYEYAICCNSAKTETYVNLAKLYALQENTSKIDALKLHIKQSDYKSKALILQKVERELLECLL